MRTLLSLPSPSAATDSVLIASEKDDVGTFIEVMNTDP